MRARTDCAALAARGGIRINRQPTGKPHARLRIGDVLTAAAARRGAGVRASWPSPPAAAPLSEARLLYEELADPPPPSCAGPETPAYRQL